MISDDQQARYRLNECMQRLLVLTEGRLCAQAFFSLPAEVSQMQRSTERAQEVIAIDRFENIVECATTQSPCRQRLIAIPCDQEDRGVWPARFDPLQQGQSVCIGHANVANDGIVIYGFDTI